MTPESGQSQHEDQDIIREFASQVAEQQAHNGVVDQSFGDIQASMLQSRRLIEADFFRKATGSEDIVVESFHSLDKRQLQT